jgi:hypothetical protein
MQASATPTDSTYELREERARLLVDLVTGPERRRRGVGGEVVDAELVDHHQVVIADQAEVTRLSSQRHALIRLAAVADEVAEIPDLVDSGHADVVEHGLERGQVGVNVADQCHARGAAAAS